MIQDRAASTAQKADREYEFSDDDFRALRDLVKNMTGISLAETKRELVYGRVSRRLRALGLKTFAEYRRLLESQNASELIEFCNALTTNLTSFFRESHHFDYLRDEFLEARNRDPHASRRIRIWSSACSSGEEPYSIAMIICETIKDLKKWDIKILATDLDTNILEIGRRGVYNQDRVKGLDAQRLSRFFRESKDGKSTSYEALPELKNLITFKQINLTHDLPMSGPLDVIFCRNVVIYFDKDTQRELFARMAKLQRYDDLLFLGHSENLFNVSSDYALIGKTIYRRSEA
jgi:chemotaxis protein methyltransferase CheR